MDFGIQLWWAALDSLCWVLMWVPPQSLVLPSSVGTGTDGTHIFPILLLWLNGWLTSHPSLTSPFIKVFLFSECTECHWSESLALQGIVAAFMMALTWHLRCFECLPSSRTSSFLMMCCLIQMLDWCARWDGQSLLTSWSLLLSWDCFCPDRCQKFDLCGDGNVWRGIPCLDRGIPWRARFRCWSLPWSASVKHRRPTLIPWQKNRGFQLLVTEGSATNFLHYLKTKINLIIEFIFLFLYQQL